MTSQVAKLVKTLASSTQSKKAKSILITGCTSGIGLQAIKLLHSIDPNHRIIVVGRTVEKAQAAIDEVVAEGDGDSTTFTAMACDHSTLQSCRDLANTLKNHLKENKLDVLCLNAGMICEKGPAFANDTGVEITFQVNQLAPFLLVQELLPFMAENGRIVITSSGLHKGPQFDDFVGCLDEAGSIRTAFAMLNSAPYDDKRAYAMSKLCNTTLCLALHERLKAKSSSISVNCFSPGFIPSTGLFRGVNPWVLPIFRFVMGTIMGVTATVEWGGGALAYLAIADDLGSGKYYQTPNGSTHVDADFTETFLAVEPPAEAVKKDNQEQLWQISETLTKLG